MEEKNNINSISSIIKITSLDTVNIPFKILKELDWGMDEKVQVDICDVINNANEEWQEIRIARKKDIHKIYDN
jgi:hypothetical protein